MVIPWFNKKQLPKFYYGVKLDNHSKLIYTYLSGNLATKRQRSRPMGGSTSRTKKTKSFSNSVTGGGSHSVTTIRGGGRQVSGAGSARESQKNASKRWDKGK